MNYQAEHRKLMAELASVQRPDEAEGLYVNIHHRLCSDKIQPEVNNSTTWKILKVLPPTKSGAKRVRIEERNFSKKQHELIVCDINSDRFDWKIFTLEEVEKVERLGMLLVSEMQKSVRKKEEIERMLELEQRRAEQMKRDHETASKILESCTEEEQLKISFNHLVLADLAWMYNDACQAMACNQGIQETKKLNRAINDYKVKYHDFLASCVEAKMISKIRENSRQISDNEEFKKISKDAWKAIKLMYRYKFGKDVPYLDLRICAQLGRMMLKSYYYAIEQSNAILKVKMDGLPYSEKSAANPMLETVDSFFDAWQGDYVLEYDSVMKTFVERWNDVFSRVKFCVGN